MEPTWVELDFISSRMQVFVTTGGTGHLLTIQLFVGFKTYIPSFSGAQ